MKFNAYDLLKEFEGLRLEAYKDVAGVWTIGYGHTGGVKAGDSITLEQAKQLLDQDLVRFEKAVNDGVKRPMTQNQYNAFVSLAYNIGVSGFLGSTALRRFNAGDVKGAADAITWWNQAGGKVVKGLVRRRAAERDLFLTPDNPLEPEAQGDLRDVLTRQLLEEYTQKLKEIWNA